MKSSSSAILLVIILGIPSSIAQPPAPPAPPSDEVPPKYHVGYRKVNWCVTGKDEPELHEWPYSQFAPIIRRWHREKHDENVRYDLRFYDITTKQTSVGNNGKLFKTVHVELKAFKRKDPLNFIKDIYEPMEIEGLLIQANANPYSLAIPTGQFFPSGYATSYANGDEPEPTEIHCNDCNITLWARQIACRKRTKIHVEHPTIMAWHYMQKTFRQKYKDQPYDLAILPLGIAPTGKTPEEPPKIESDGRQTEVHANFRWYSPQCAAVRRMMFTILVVRSFVNHQYDIFHRGPYEVTVRDQDFQSDLHPSPYFLFYTQDAMCHSTSASDLTLEHPQKFKDFEMNHFYDCCVREEENWKTKMTHELLKSRGQPTTSCYHKLYSPIQDPLTIVPGNESSVCFFPFAPKYCLDADFEDPRDYYPPCGPCKEPLTTTTEMSTQKPDSIYKRTLHGALMVMTNFCLQPIVIYIARFYKETFNTKSYKGAKSWYLMHLIGGLVSSSMVYLGYFSSGDDDSFLTLSHIAVGKVYIVTLGICYCTAWGRHKNNVITITAEFMHGCFGYVTITLALFSVWSAPRMQFTSKLLVGLMVCTQAFFMIILTCQICVLDRRFGMRPKRRHFPTVEARFDEVAVPGAKFRIIMLIIFSALTFGLSMASTFFE